MDIKQIIYDLEHPNDPYRKDLIVLREGLLYLLRRVPAIAEMEAGGQEPPKKPGRPKKDADDPAKDQSKG